jgi:hypothetical protein
LHVVLIATWGIATWGIATMGDCEQAQMATTKNTASMATWSNRLAEDDRRDDGSDVEIRRDAAPIMGAARSALAIFVRSCSAEVHIHGTAGRRSG